MKTETHSTAWISVGWIGLALFLLTWVEVALPAARRLLASIFPVQVFGSLLVASALCITAGIFKKRWFLVPGIAALLSIALFLVSVFSE